MSKKAYISPEMKIYEVEAESMLALSLNEGDAKEDVEVLSIERDEEYEDIWSSIF